MRSRLLCGNPESSFPGEDGAGLKHLANLQRAFYIRRPAPPFPSAPCSEETLVHLLSRNLRRGAMLPCVTAVLLTACADQLAGPVAKPAAPLSSNAAVVMP